MFGAGAVLGPVLDGTAHGNFGVLSYHNPPPISVGIAGFTFFKTAIWVPFLFGIAGALIGGLFAFMDDKVATPQEQRKTTTAFTLFAVGSFCLNYLISGFMWAKGVVSAPIFFVLALWALAQWRLFDKSAAGLLVALATAIGGPIIELFLVNAPWWDLYGYAEADFFGVDSWIPWVYFCGATAVGLVARLVRSTLEDQRS